MGFFSWMTQDTGRSISNRYSNHGTFPVVMVDNNNNQWVEEDYQGYGIFGNKDYYELLAEMNGKTTRDDGIDLYFGDEPFISPNLIEQSSAETWKWVDECPEDCPDQGYFYYDDEDDDN